MDNNRVISLLGCGWLGLPLAKSLVSKGFTVRATTTTISKLEVLKLERIDPYLVQFSRDSQVPDLKKLFDAETLVVTVPPGRRDPNGFENYRMMVQFICGQLQGSKLSRLILISSTAVYGDKDDIQDEFSMISPGTESGQLMAETEAHLEKQDVSLIILRLAGLIGPGRMPGKFFAGKIRIPNGLAPVNLIHLNDVIRIIHKLIEDPKASGVYNGCAPVHPTKQDFYTLAAELERLEKPRFISEKTSGKIISSSRLSQELNYRFEFPSPMDWLRSSDALGKS